MFESMSTVSGHYIPFPLHGGLEAVDIAVGHFAGLGGNIVPDGVVQGIQVAAVGRPHPF